MFRRPGEHLLIAAGVAVTALALAGVLGGSLLARERAVEHAVQGVGPRNSCAASWGSAWTEREE
jgi:hypothetical protein